MDTSAAVIETDPGMLWVFRDLKATDLFPLARVISKLGVNRFVEAFGSEEVLGLVSNIKGETTDMQTMVVGLSAIAQVVQVILENMEKCEADIFNLLSSTSNLTLVQVKDLDIDELLVMIVEFVKKPEFKRFFDRALKLFR